MAAYSLARLRYRGRMLFSLIIGTLMVPFWVIMIPLYIEVRAFGWLDTYWALIIAAIPNVFGISLLHQFYLGIPKELEEAATIDGCSKAGIFFRIVLPISRPIMAQEAADLRLSGLGRHIRRHAAEHGPLEGVQQGPLDLRRVPR